MFVFCRSGNFTLSVNLSSAGSYFDELGLYVGVVFLLCRACFLLPKHPMPFQALKLCFEMLCLRLGTW